MMDSAIPDDRQSLAANEVPADEVAAWEQLEPGRYMPRRIRGSNRGGKLG